MGSTTLLALTANITPAFAQSAMPNILVEESRDIAERGDASAIMTEADIAPPRRAVTSDTASLLAGIPGVSLYSAR